MTRFRTLLLVLTSCSTLALAGCESDEDKAERFYQAGLALIEQGDNERAALELRNVFNHDNFHQEARMLYAQLMLDLDRPRDAYGQYLRLVEQYPDTVEARVALARLAMLQNDWPEVVRHGEAAVALAPDQPDVQAIDVALRYRQASLDKDSDARIAAAADAQVLLDALRASDTPDESGLVRLIIDNHMQNEEPARALDAVNAALERTPDIEDLHIFKVRLLDQMEDTEGTGTQLRTMVERFPENTLIKQSLIAWYIDQGDMAGAEAFLRKEAGEDTGPVEGHLQVIQMLQSTQGTEAARAELIRLRAANEGTENGRTYIGLLGTMDFQAGEQDKAIADVRAAVDASDEGEQKVRLQIILARMLGATDATEEARALIDTVIESDPSNIDALRMRAAWLIAEDNAGEAIVDLRRALDQNPRDAATLTMMAQAHEREGDTELVGERLALAMEASNNGVPETLRYARFLNNQDRDQVALTVLEDARRRAPDNIQLITELANMHLRSNDWDATRALAADLKRLGSDRAATELEARILQGENRTEESLALLQEQLVDASDGSDSGQTRAISLIVQTQIRGGRLDAARQTLDDALVDAPDNPNLKLLSAALYAVEGNNAESETIYRELIEAFPQAELPVRLLVNMLASTGRMEESRATLETALQVQPDTPELLLIQASYLEKNNEFEQAIAIYERLYEINSNNPVVSNNLASLITTHRDDAESLTRAARIVRRLRDSDVPAFQDTYGWIAYRRDSFEEAVEYLEPAAAGLPQEPLVQYHLGMAYAALNRTADAKAQLEKALEIAGDSTLPQFQTARETLGTLE